jgi:hypothetical protein
MLTEFGYSITIEQSNSTNNMSNNQVTRSYSPPKERKIPEWRVRATSEPRSMTNNNSGASPSSPTRFRKRYRPTGPSYKPVPGQAPIIVQAGNRDMSKCWRRTENPFDNKSDVLATEEHQSAIAPVNERHQINNKTPDNIFNVPVTVEQQASIVRASEGHQTLDESSTRISNVQVKVEQSSSLASKYSISHIEIDSFQQCSTDSSCNVSQPSTPTKQRGHRRRGRRNRAKNASRTTIEKPFLKRNNLNEGSKKFLSNTDPNKPAYAGPSWGAGPDPRTLPLPTFYTPHTPEAILKVNKYRNKSRNPITPNQPECQGLGLVLPHASTLEIPSCFTPKPASKVSNYSNTSGESTTFVSQIGDKYAADISDNGSSVTNQHEDNRSNSSFVTSTFANNGSNAYLVANPSDDSDANSTISVSDNERESNFIANSFECDLCEVPGCTIDTRAETHAILDDTYVVRRRIREEIEAHRDEWNQLIYQEILLIPDDHRLSSVEVKHFFETVLEKIVWTKRWYRNCSLSQQTLPTMYQEYEDKYNILSWIDDVEAA